jgi:selenophosphate synthase
VTISSAEPSADLAPDNDALARDMIDVHGPGAAGVARENARAAAVVGRAVDARKWLGVVDIIQRRIARSADEAALRPNP